VSQVAENEELRKIFEIAADKSVGLPGVEAESPESDTQQSVEGDWIVPDSKTGLDKAINNSPLVAFEEPNLVRTTVSGYEIYFRFGNGRIPKSFDIREKFSAGSAYGSLQGFEKIAIQIGDGRSLSILLMMPDGYSGKIPAIPGSLENIFTIRYVT